MRKRILVRIWWVVIFLFSSSVIASNLEITDIALQSKKRVGRTLFEYTYTATTSNAGEGALGVVANLTSPNPNTVVVEGEVSFGNIAFGQTVVSADTFTIQQDRKFPFDPTQSLKWSFQENPAVNLITQPASVRTSELNSELQLQVFIDDGDSILDVTTDPNTVYNSSNLNVVTVDTQGIATFAQNGVTSITIDYAGFAAVINVEVDTSSEEMVEGVIDSRGGVLKLPSGTSVSIPQGAIPSNEVVSIEAAVLPVNPVVPVGAVVAGQVYDFKPYGFQFDSPIQITYAYDVGEVPAGFDESSLALYFVDEITNEIEIDSLPQPDGEEVLIEGPTQSIDTDNKTIVAETDHFSLRVPLVSTVRLAPTQLKTIDGCNVLADKGCEVINITQSLKSLSNPISRSTSDITHLVLHSTQSGVKFANLLNSWVLKSSTTAWAHYYIDVDGTIVQVTEDNIVANHVADTGRAVTDSISIGIEIHNPCGKARTPTNPVAESTCTPNVQYPGRQLSAVVRLLDLLKQKYNIPNVNIVTHAEQDFLTAPVRKTDPGGDFRTAVMGAPSIQEIVINSALDDLPIGGQINAKGGDALGVTAPGNGGNVQVASALIASTSVNDKLSSLVVPKGATMTIKDIPGGSVEVNGVANAASGNKYMHIIVEGALRMLGDTTLDLGGIFYVGQSGVVDGRNTNIDGGDGYDLTVDMDGFALIEGHVYANGHNKLSDPEIAPFVLGSGIGNGGAGGDVILSSVSPGPVWVPTIITRGGDGDSAEEISTTGDGGDGGNINIQVLPTAEWAKMIFTGGSDIYLLPIPASIVDAPFPVDTLPPPAPFSVYAGNCVRPELGERLQLRQYSGDGSLGFERGLITSGGGGGIGTDGLGGNGGNGGSIMIENNSANGGAIIFEDVDLVTGSGSESRCFTISGVGLSIEPNGGLGGRGKFNGGSGGNGGAGGDITITGNINGPTGIISTTTTPIIGHNGGTAANPVTEVIGQEFSFNSNILGNGLRTNSSAGSAGPAAGSATSFRGFYGLKGVDGITTINGVQQYP